jgi:hypothetical protein
MRKLPLVQRKSRPSPTAATSDCKTLSDPRGNIGAMSDQSTVPAVPIKAEPAPQPRERLSVLRRMASHAPAPNWIAAGCAVIALCGTPASMVYSRRQANREQRAWMTVDHIEEVKGHPSIAETRFRVRVLLKNSGKTPAIRSVTYAWLGFGPRGGTAEFVAQRPRPNAAGGTPSIVAPGDRSEFDHGPLTAEEAEEAAKTWATGGGIYLATRTEYQDVFGNAHWTESCHYKTNAITSDEWWTCAGGNSVSPP